VKTGLQDRLRRPQPERVAPDTGPMTGSISNQHPSTIRGRPSPQPSDVSRVRRDLAVDRDWWRRRRRRHSGGSPRQHVSRHYGASEARARQRTTVGEMAGERPASGWKRMRAEIGSWFERWPYEDPPRCQYPDCRERPTWTRPEGWWDEEWQKVCDQHRDAMGGGGAWHRIE
jgi:hypothetical protein